MEAHNPILIPRNFLVDEAIKLAEGGDLSKFETLLSRILKPYDYDVKGMDYLLPPKSDKPFVTYCGT